MSDHYPGLSREQLVEHLEHDFGGVLDRADIRSCAIAAIADLRGSICAEALPEMAYKLASHRLRARLDHAASPTKVSDFVGAARR
jgi:hypothetical protein